MSNDCRFISNDVLKEEPILYNGPPPSPVVIQAPPIPPISLLVRSIIDSSDWLFYVSHSLGNPFVWEWHLIRVALSDSTSLSSLCLQDGRFLVKFYILHFDDFHFNVTSQHYWLQYHSIGEIAIPTSSTTTHLIRPSNSSEAPAAKQKLILFRWCLNLTHSDTYLHGSFEFASVNGWKTRDWISKSD